MSTPDRRLPLGPPPPSAGAHAAIRAARHRRQRARLLAGGGLAAALVGVVAVSVLTGGGRQALPADRLGQLTEPTNGPRATTGPEAGGSPSPTATPGPTGTASARPAAEPSTAPTTGSAAQPTTTPESPYRTPAMRRTFEPASTAPVGAKVCSASDTDGTGQFGSRVNWCYGVDAEATAAGHRLSVKICRDDSGPGTLGYRDALETDLTVLSGDTEVWRWSADHSPDGPPHVLEVPTSRCFTWTVDWTDVDRTGTALKPGEYSLLATSHAGELQQLPSERTTLRVE